MSGNPLVSAPASCFDLGKQGLLYPGDSLAWKLTEGTAAATILRNTYAIEQAFRRIGYHPGTNGDRGYRDSIYLPAGSYITDKMIWGVQPYDGISEKAYAGARMTTGGGVTGSLFESTNPNRRGNTSRLTYGGADRTEGAAHVTLPGYGMWFDPFEMHGFRIVSGTDWANRNDTAFFTKCPEGIHIQSTNPATDGVNNGTHTFFGLAGMGYDHLIHIEEIGSGGNSAHIQISLLEADSCGTMLYCDAIQGLNHCIDKVITHWGVDCGFDYQAGGDLVCNHYNVNNPNHTVLRIGPGYDSNFGSYVVKHIKIDNYSDNFQLLDLQGTAATRDNVAITLIGQMSDATYEDKEDVISGEFKGGDAIYIRIMGPNGPITELNEMSTVDSPHAL